jgi:hypothetical protein
MPYDKNNHVKALMKVLSLNWVETTFRRLYMKIQKYSKILILIWSKYGTFNSIFWKKKWIFRSYEFFKSKSLIKF